MAVVGMPDILFVYTVNKTANVTMKFTLDAIRQFIAYFGIVECDFFIFARFPVVGEIIQFTYRFWGFQRPILFVSNRF